MYLLALAAAAAMADANQLDGLWEIPNRVLGMLGGQRPFDPNQGRAPAGMGQGVPPQQQQVPVQAGQGAANAAAEGEGEGEAEEGAQGGTPDVPPGDRVNQGQQGQQGQAQQQQGQQEQNNNGTQQQQPPSCMQAAAKCNSNILCGTALRKQLPICQNPIFPKRCFKCQMATSVLTATPEGREYMQCECGIDLFCRARRRLQSSCLSGGR